ncbi:MAG: adenylate/guanylate cyclase domain-containing protein, partial [Armatimonadetes bacterium]|nr:adenylate/guanylate cyclase domain-containing protein [Armatimonadota bacterium]
MSSLPTGTVSLLYADIEGATRLLQRLGGRYADVLAAYRQILREAAADAGGQEIDAPGDAFFVAFPRASDAVAAALAAQRAILTCRWPDSAAVRVRMGLHTGEPIRANGGYIGLDVHRTARLCAAGHGGQILLSRTTAELVAHDLPAGAGLRDLGEHRLKDLQQPERIFQIVHPD